MTVVVVGATVVAGSLVVADATGAVEAVGSVVVVVSPSPQAGMTKAAALIITRRRRKPLKLLMRRSFRGGVPVPRDESHTFRDQGLMAVAAPQPASDHRSRATGGIMSIVVAGVDDSPVSMEVLEKAIEQASWRKAELHVVHVVRFPMTYTQLPVDITEVIEAERRTVWERLEPTMAGAGLTVRRVDLDGYPPDTLVAYTSSEEAVLLVVGTRGRGEIASLILGSTSHRAIQLAECDVLVVKESRDQD